ncbi:MAG: GIY-YIG nuclease family protein [Cyclobacteriaceae bacterium]|jgi:putative endonuclease|nr:GIY-YIG nuclease family protein [Cyclobacteriaceae bacterium]
MTRHSENFDGFFICLHHFKMFVVYILYSDITSRFYIGQTDDLINRLKEHNAGETPSIKNGKPWRVVWSVQVSSRSEAVMLETKIKNRGAKRFLHDNGILTW